jgi:hypothetical protein
MTPFSKTFFLGIGAAKSGTSWVYDYLARHPEVNAGPIKEMHVLNSPGQLGLYRSIRGLPWHRFAGRKWLKENLQKAYYRSDWNRYFKLYENLLKGRFSTTGEISTSYMSIPVETLQMVQQRFSDAGVRTVGILLLRDPVDRLISDIRFHKRLSSENRYVPTIKKSLDELVKEAALGGQKSISSEYQNAISTMVKVFDENDRFIEL